MTMRDDDEDFLQIVRDKVVDPRRYFEEDATGHATMRSYRLQHTNVDPKDSEVYGQR